MGFARLVFSFLIKLRQVFQAAASRLFERAKDPETGKLKYISPSGAKRVLTAFSVVFFGVIIVSQLLTRGHMFNDSFDDYTKEIKSDGGTRMRDTGNHSLFDKNPLAFGNTKDPLTEVLNSRSTLDEAAPVAPAPVAPVAPALGAGKLGAPSATDSVAVPAASECFAVVEKAKSGASLSISDRARLSSCLANSVIPVSDGEKAVLQALAAKDVTPAEAKALLSSLKGDAGEKAQELSDIIAASVDPTKQGTIKDGVNRELGGRGVSMEEGEVRGLSKTLADKPKSFEQAIDGTSKILAGNSPGEGEKANIVDAIRALKGGEGAALDNPNLTPDKKQAIQALIDDVQARDVKLQEIKQQLAEAQADARKAAEKIASGATLTPEEQAALDKMSALRKEASALEATQEKRQRSLIELTAQMQKIVAAAEVSIQKTIPSGVFEGYADYQPLDCKNIKPLVKVARHSPSQETAEDRRRRLESMRLKQKPGVNVYKVEDEIAKSAVNPDGKRLDISKYAQQEMKIADNFVMKGQADKGPSLSLDLKIAAMLDSEVMVASNGGGQVVRIKIIQDVFDSKNRRLVIPKNSIGAAHASSFDEATGLMSLTIDKIASGSGNTQVVQLRVGSGDGSMGLRGQVRDTRGRYLLGAFITSFTAGALNWFTQNTITSYQQSAVAATAMAGSAYSGGADVAQKIANMYASDLQNAPRIFWAPRGLPLVLYPD